MRAAGPLAVGALLVLVLVPGLDAQRAGPGDPGDRLYGRVVTLGGEVFEGFIRWGSNEGSWTDVLNGNKELPYENVRDAERLGMTRGVGDDERAIELFGIRVTWGGGDDYPDEVQSGIRFGHVAHLRVLDDDAALLVLKSGQEVELEGGSSDLWPDLTVEDPDRGRVELDAHDLDEVEFMPVPHGIVPVGGERLYGTLRTREGHEFTGYVAWDQDEILTTDILDGDEGSRDWEIPFGNVAAIERNGSRSARVILDTGEELVLDGSNDVDRSNRGIVIADPELGQVIVGWDAFSDLTFVPSPGTPGYDDFDGGYRLRGTVVARDGRELEGWIRWDNDEAYSWEILDGERRDVEFDVELGRVAVIERRGRRSAQVTLWDGRVFELEGSNDVDDGNKGIFVVDDRDDVSAVAWEDFREVRFERR